MDGLGWQGDQMIGMDRHNSFFRTRKESCVSLYQEENMGRALTNTHHRPKFIETKYLFGKSYILQDIFHVESSSINLMLSVSLI